MTSLDQMLRWSPLQLVSGWANSGRVGVLAFHGVDDPEAFARNMDYVARHYRPISVEDLHRGLSSGAGLHSRSVLVTFDDGHRSVLEHALPILTERGIPSVAFVIAGLLSSSRDYWWSSVLDLSSHGGTVTGCEQLTGDQLVGYLKTVPNDVRLAAIKELEISAGRSPAPRSQIEDGELALLERGGITIGNHTWSHPCLNRCDSATIRDEIERSHHHLKELLGRAPAWFAYPNGDWAPDAEGVLADLGYQLGFLFDHRHARRSSDPLRVSRLRVNSDTPSDRFATILSGLHPSIHHARGRS
jgi:peptidoglycan/xylan/chitin deacetylase (PgdA/CDA1 family)